MFIEFLRRRLILAREILADDGTIYVHLDNKMSHYMKIIMDEVFGKNNFRNEIVWHYFMGGKPKKYFANKHDTLLVYKKGGENKFNEQVHKRVLPYVPNLKSNKGLEEIECKNCSKGSGIWRSEVKVDDVWDLSGVFNLSNEYIDYPTQKPEELLERIIKSSTDEGDLVLDFFGGSGTTMAVAEKLNRRWIVCDIGKLSFFTMQKRILDISKSKALGNSNKKYRKKYKPFITTKLGFYDLKKTFSLDWGLYVSFVSNLFKVKMQNYEINGIHFNGKKNDSPVKIFDYIKHEDTGIDSEYVRNLHESLGEHNYNHIYIISPATRVKFIADYEVIDNTKYFFLRVPYEVIDELHKSPFKKMYQPRSKGELNKVDDMIGFQFISPPEVVSEIVGSKLVIKSFTCSELDSQSEKNKFDLLSAVYIDYDYKDGVFELDEYFFAADIIAENICEIELKNTKGKMMVIYSDIYGNDFSETITLEGE
jgi:site-specific DNA-methyltransferase (adenine-specific)/adenine-specific DNA-methyltransferase